jgi:hypothetical protein
MLQILLLKKKIRNNHAKLLLHNCKSFGSVKKKIIMEKNFYRIASPLNQFEIKAFFSNKRSFSNTISLEAKEDRPKLKIDTSVASTGNEGLDKEKQ